MGTSSTMGPFQARLLKPVLNGPGSLVSGHLEPLGSGQLRGSHSNPAATKLVATGGYPAPLMRQFSFAVLFRAPKLVNLVQGVKSNPGNYKGS